MDRAGADWARGRLDAVRGRIRSTAAVRSCTAHGGNHPKAPSPAPSSLGPPTESTGDGEDTQGGGSLGRRGQARPLGTVLPIRRLELMYCRMKEPPPDWAVNSRGWNTSGGIGFRSCPGPDGGQTQPKAHKIERSHGLVGGFRRSSCGPDSAGWGMWTQWAHLRPSGPRHRRFGRCRGAPVSVAKPKCTCIGSVLAAGQALGLSLATPLLSLGHDGRGMQGRLQLSGHLVQCTA